MAEIVEIRLKATDGTVSVWKNAGAAAQKMGDQVEDAGKRGAAAQKKLQDQLTSTGAAIGTVVGITSKLGQAHLSEERQIGALGRAYGEQADTINDLAAKMQSLGIASDDSVRISALGAQSLAKNYGLTADQIQQLIVRSADLTAVTFDQFGAQMNLTDVMQRAQSAIRGEAESAEVLGVAMSDTRLASLAAAEGLTGWTTTMTDAEKAAFRLKVFMEDTASAQGAAGEQADTLAGKVNAMKLQVVDGAAAFGGMLGPVTEAASVLGDVALAAPLVGGAMGKIAGSTKAMSLGMGALSLATGPVGLVAAAVAGGVALYALSQRQTDAERTTEALAKATTGYTQTIIDNTTALVNAGLYDEVSTTEDYLTLLETNGGIAAERVKQVTTAITDLQEITDAGRLNNGLVVTAEDLSLTDQYVLDLLEMNGALTDGYVSMAELQAVQAQLAAGFVLTGDQAAKLKTQVSGLTDELLDPELAGSEIQTEITNILTSLESGALTFDQASTALQALEDDTTAYNLALRTQATESRSSAQAVALMTGALDSQVVVVEATTGAYTANSIAIAMNKQERRGLAQDAALATMTIAETAAIAANTAAMGYQIDELDALIKQRDAAFATGQRKQEGRGQEQDAYLAAERAAAERAITEGIENQALGLSVQTTDMAELRALADERAAAELEVAQAVLAATQSYAGMVGTTNALDAGISVVIGGLDNLGAGVEKVDTSLRGLAGAAGEWGTLDDLVHANRITWDEYDAAVEAADDTTANNAATQASLGVILANQAPLLADLAYQQSQYVTGLAELPAEQQLLALAYMDSAESAKALELQTLALSAANGELGEGGKGFAKDIIRGAAEADPILKAMVVDMGLITVGAEGTIKVKFGEGTSEIENLTQSINQLAGNIEVQVGIDLNEDGIKGYVPPKKEMEVEPVINEAAAPTFDPITWPVDLKINPNAPPTFDPITVPVEPEWPQFDAVQIAPPPVKVAYEYETFDPPELKNYTATITVDIGAANETVGELDQLLATMDTATATPTVDIDAGLFNTGYTTVTANVETLDALNPIISIGGDGQPFWDTMNNVQVSKDQVDGWNPIVSIGGESDGWYGVSNQVAGSVSSVDAWSATVDINGNAQPYYASLPTTGITIGTNYIDVLTRQVGGDSSGPYQRFATGGSVTARMGEVGPEAVTIPGSAMRAIAPRDGLYTVPEGSYVSPAVATRGMGGGGSGGMNFAGATIYVVASTPDIHDALNGQLLAQGRR